MSPKSCDARATFGLGQDAPHKTADASAAAFANFLRSCVCITVISSFACCDCLACLPAVTTPHAQQERLGWRSEPHAFFQCCAACRCWPSGTGALALSHRVAVLWRPGREEVAVAPMGHAIHGLHSAWVLRGMPYWAWAEQEDGRSDSCFPMRMARLRHNEHVQSARS